MVEALFIYSPRSTLELFDELTLISLGEVPAYA